MKNLHAQVDLIGNLSEFSVRSKIPLRTLQRIKSRGSEYRMSTTTALALQSALKRLKPKVKP